MMTAQRIRSAAQKAASEMVRWAAFERGSRMLAYEVVARKVGAPSAECIRKIARGYTTADPSPHVFLNLMAGYRDLCDRLERCADDRRLTADLAKELCDEIAGGLSARRAAEHEGALLD